ncbi:MAG TPA: site-specific integrase [Crocinitomicaceae bacterium]|nr:site-specific integrase [Crocinitomicaceae bacterium]
MPKISFFVRSSSANSDMATVFCRVTYNGEKKEFTLREQVKRSDWCTKLQNITQKCEQEEFINTLKTKLTYKIKTLAVMYECKTVTELLELLQPKPKPKPLLLSEICQLYINAIAPNVASGTVRNHRIKTDNLRKFEQYQKCTFTPEEFTTKTAHTFIDWFQTTNRTHNKTSANRNVLFYAMVLKWYRNQGNKIESELLHFQGEKDSLKSPIFLTLDELQRFEKTTFVGPMLNRVKDLFLFQCYTGLSYCDIWGNWELKREDYGTILTGTRGKNAQLYFLPVEYDKVTEIIERYGGQLPQYCNAVYNRILKELAHLCNIDKRITTHTARKTFATLMDANGWSRETVAKMLGHKSVRTTEMYYLGECVARIELEMKSRIELKKAV